MTTIDTSRTIEIHHSPAKMAVLLVLSLLMTAGGGLILAVDPANVLAGVVGLVFFGMCTAVIAWRLFTARGAALILSPEGIRDVRVSNDVVPWKAVQSISTWEHKGQKVMILALDPEFEKTLSWTPIAKWTRQANRLVGADGYCITATGIKISYDTLLMTASVYAEAARRGTTLTAGRTPSANA